MITIETLLCFAETQGWAVTPPLADEMGDIEFSKYSPIGQDFNFNLEKKETASELIDELDGYIEAFDPIYEAHLWVGNDGHGRNGAPDDPRDIIADMEDCEEMMKNLLEGWRELCQQDTI